MARWIIGDLQGCFEELLALLEAIDWEPARDEVWLAGDLVNRGPGSLQVLRWAAHQDERVQAVLGNHDLHLLGRALGLRKRRKKDTLQPVLDARDADELIAWLRHQPLLIGEDGLLMLHAALHPEWSLDEAHALAQELQALLRGPDASRLLQDKGFKAPLTWAEARADEALRLPFALAVMTRLRCFDTSLRTRWDHVGTLAAVPSDRVPWFRVPHRRGPDGPKVYFGHWAALGHHVEAGVESVDTGCLWGNKLTAVCSDDGRVVSVRAGSRATGRRKPR